jgi:lysophospholipase L1-like esterase
MYRQLLHWRNRGYNLMKQRLMNSIFLKISRFTVKAALLLLLVILSVHANRSVVFAALPITEDDIRRINRRENYRDPEASRNCSITPPIGNIEALPAGSTIYMLGDSITVGMRDSGSIENKFTDSGWSTVKINAVGGQNLSWGIEQVTQDRDTIAQASTVIIGLGTNNIASVVSGSNTVPNGRESVKTQAQAIIDGVRTANSNAKIYWTSVYVTGILETSFGTFDMDIARSELNIALTEVANSNNVSIIPWGTSGEALRLISSDGIHPFGKYDEMADFITTQLKGQQGVSTNSNCSCTTTSLSGSNNIEKVFNFFTGVKKTSPEIAAGIIGNMIHESGVEPMRLQNEFDRLVSSSEAISIAVPGSNLGWGLVQWTPGTKIIQTASNAGIPFTEIDTVEFQLDFLWGQLKGESWPGNPNNESSEKSAGDKILASATVEEAAINFGRYYERFADSSNLNNPEYKKRIDSALEVITTVSGSGSTSISCAGDLQPGPNGWDLPGEGPNPMVYYSQRSSGDPTNDPAVEGYFGSESYGPGPISHCGCGPTSWAMVVSTLTSRRVTPPEVANWASKNGFQQSGDPCGGSLWWWADNATLSSEEWGVQARSISITDAANSLRSGALIMVSVDNGPFTSGGHLLVMRAVTDDGKYLFADPNDYSDQRQEASVFEGESKSRVPLSEEDFMGSVKGLWEIKAL